MSSAIGEEYLTVEQLSQRLGWTSKTVQNKMGPKGIFKRGIHYAHAPGLPIMFKWSAVLELYDWTPESPQITERQPISTAESGIPMARGYLMK